MVLLGGCESSVFLREIRNVEVLEKMEEKKRKLQFFHHIMCSEKLLKY